MDNDRVESHLLQIKLYLVRGESGKALKYVKDWIQLLREGKE